MKSAFLESLSLVRLSVRSLQWGACFGLTTACAIGCGSSDANSTPVPAVDSGPDDEPIFDSDDPKGRVLVLRLYDPAKRCLLPPTEIGYFREGSDGKIAPCVKSERCYVRPDGIAAYHTEDCIEPGRYLANWTNNAYSDLSVCEPVKNLLSEIKDCPVSSCVFARDLTIETGRGCATAITSKGCRDKLKKPDGCFCEAGTDRVILRADGKSSPTLPPTFAPCDPATSSACKKALDVIDTVKGCVGGSDAGVDATPDVAGDSSGDSAGDSASDSAVDGADVLLDSGGAG